VDDVGNLVWKHTGSIRTAPVPVESKRLIQDMQTRIMDYVLITPARNEAKFIEQTVRSVIFQTVLPKKWIVVSDGSTDGTDEIVKKYLDQHPWLDLVRMPDGCDRSFAAKVQSFNAGYSRMAGLQYDIIGNLDADITFEKDYFEFLLGKFREDPNLGVAGTPFVEGKESYDYRFTNIEHVSGACQLFRRKCFEDIGGYTPVGGGGIDWIAVTTARMKGWKTRTFVEKVCHHHRPMGTANAGLYKAYYRLGRQDYYLGGHPLWQTLRACFQLTRKPYVFGGMHLFAGYWWALLTGVKRSVSPELKKFHQGEQLKRLRQMFSKTL
jgi:glycosyltransferase involved in cell wall biosynthesis